MLFLFIALLLAVSNISHLCLGGDSEGIGNTNVIMPLEVLVKPNTSIMHGLSTLGILDSFAAFCSNPTIHQSSVTGRYFDILKKMEGVEETNSPLRWQGLEAPPILKKHLVSSNYNPAILIAVNEHIKKQKQSDAALLLYCAESTFDPAKNAETMVEVSDAVPFLQKLRDHNNTIHVVDNWHPTSLDQLKTKCKKLFSLINGSIVVSGHVGRLKSDGLYQKFFEQTPLAPENTVIVEPHLEYAENAPCGYTVITPKDDTLASIETSLITQKVLPETSKSWWW